ncbi:hypothetical protein C1H46_007585 [Malus baccata]|uniref:Uncharacterized protein n=1 Tax=Malus baccata TaxID=106549 RepID=A0A540N8B8_MALBA|nr:hypothetical protein C1H46_007585 [Malus baccata]
MTLASSSPPAATSLPPVTPSHTATCLTPSNAQNYRSINNSNVFVDFVVEILDTWLNTPIKFPVRPPIPNSGRPIPVQPQNFYF